MKAIFSFMILALSLQTLSAQATPETTNNVMESKLKVIFKVTDDGVKLRWAPTSKEDWYLLQKSAYEIHRATFTKQLPSDSDYEKIATVQVKSEEHFASVVENNSVDDYYKLAGMATYGEWETTKPGDSSLDNWGHRVEELESRYLTVMYSCDMSFAAAEAVGLAYHDKSIVANQNYVYKISIPSDSLNSPVFKVILQNDRREEPVLTIDKGAEKENQVVLSWDRATNEKHFTAYHIEKSKDGKKYSRLTKRPYINAETSSIGDLPYVVYFDSVQNYDPHYYRVIGIDPFGDESRPSEGMKLMGRDRTPPKAPLVDSAYLAENQNVVRLKWSFEEKSDDLEEVIIKKGPQFEGPYYPIGKASRVELQYQDPKPSLVMTQYYQVCAVDTAGNEACSPGKYAIFNDRIAPAPPTGLTGTIDSSGVVTLRWELGPEEDIFGYYVHKSNGKGRVFTNMTNHPVRDVVWRDTITLHTLTETVYYKVNAVDLRKNFGQFSEFIELAKPDTIPPRPSVFKGYKVEDDHISLDVALSSSSDLSKVILLRKEVATGLEKEISLELNAENYKDTDIRSNVMYLYDLISYDDANLQTPSPQAIKLQAKDDKRHHKVKLEYEKEEQNVKLLWSDAKGEVDFVKIYRGKNETSMLTYKTVRSGTEFATSVSAVGSQFIKIKFFYKDGAKSAFSNIVQVL